MKYKPRLLGMCARCLASGLGIFVLGSLAVHPSARATGPTVEVQVLETLPSTDGKPSAVHVFLGVDGVQNLSIVAEVRTADGAVVEAHSSALSVGPGESGAGEARAGAVIEFSRPATAPLPDGTYAERIQVDAEIVSYDYPVRRVDYRYFLVRAGRLAPISSTQYSALTADVDSSGEPAMSAAPADLVLEARAPGYGGGVILVQSGDTGITPNDTERNEP